MYPYTATILLAIAFMCSNKASAQGIRRNVAVADTIYTKPTVLASYPGGPETWKKYLAKHTRYPRKAWWNELETEVVVQVIIGADGAVEDARHLTTSGYGFEQEAVRLVLKSGRWIPATYQGRPVKSQGSLTIPFRLPR